MKFDLNTTLCAFEEQKRIDTARHHLMARCGHCDHGRRIEVSTLIGFFGEEARFHMVEENLVCPICEMPAKQYLMVLIIE